MQLEERHLCGQTQIGIFERKNHLIANSCFNLSNGHSPQIRENGELLVRMCRMRVTFFQK
jgi:hypothetical protein